MSKILDLRQKRTALWEKTKNFLDGAKREGDVLSAEDAATYEKMENDIVAMGREIDMLERQAELEKQMNAPINKPVLNNPEGTKDTKIGTASDEYKTSFWKAMQRKDTYDVRNALQIGTSSEGGYLVPDEFESTLIDMLEEENIIRGLAKVIQSANGDKIIPIIASHGTASWTEEGGEYTESDDTFGVVNLGAHKLTTIVKVSDELLNDSAFNLETYIAQEFARRMSAAEEEAFITGNGTGKPTGIITSADVGITSKSAAAITSDEIMDLYHSLKTPYRKNAVFITNDSTVKAIRKLKDTTGQYLWQPGLQAGQPDTILNKPIRTSAFVPEIASGNKIMLFGDLSYYWISDRQGRIFQRLNELYAKTGQVGFKVSQRVDGKLILPEAVKTLKMGA